MELHGTTALVTEDPIRPFCTNTKIPRLLGKGLLDMFSKHTDTDTDTKQAFFSITTT